MVRTNVINIFPLIYITSNPINVSERKHLLIFIIFNGEKLIFTGILSNFTHIIQTLIPSMNKTQIKESLCEDSTISNNLVGVRMGHTNPKSICKYLDTGGSCFPLLWHHRTFPKPNTKKKYRTLPLPPLYLRSHTHTLTSLGLSFLPTRPQ